MLSKFDDMSDQELVTYIKRSKYQPNRFNPHVACTWYLLFLPPLCAFGTYWTWLQYHDVPMSFMFIWVAVVFIAVVLATVTEQVAENIRGLQALAELLLRQRKE